MGWTSTDARFYTADGKVNRKAECDALYTWEGEKTKNEVIKSSMRGSVYYAAVRTTDKTTGHSEVFAAVCLTSTRRDGGFNFGYKGMTEDMGPCEGDCPKGILVLLTDTESKYAKEWRERCWAKIRDKKQNRQSLASIKIGEIIEFERGGVTIRAEKMAPAYQFKTPWFKVVGEFEYVHKTEIKDWRIVADNAATPSETPQISTEAAETVNVSAEEEKAGERAKFRVSRFGGYKIIVGDRVQGKAIAVLMSVNGHNTIEINDESAHIATMGEKPLQIDKPIMQLSDAEVLELIYGHTQPPQSPETPQTVKCTTDTPKPRETARNGQIGLLAAHRQLGAIRYAIHYAS